jgi:hypothetical protein
LSALLLGVLLAAGVTAGCQATGGAGGCRPASAAVAAEVAPKPKPKRTADRKPTCTKATSDVWKGFKPYRGDIKTDGARGSKQRFFQWDATHGDIEVYDHNGDHLGSMDPSSGTMTKPPVKGRTLRGLR